MALESVDGLVTLFTRCTPGLTLTFWRGACCLLTPSHADPPDILVHLQVCNHLGLCRPPVLPVFSPFSYLEGGVGVGAQGWLPPL